MKLSDLCIQRPVFTLVINILIVVVGLVSFLRLEVRDLPKMETGTATITTTYSGADGTLIENEITSVIEEEIAGVEGIDFIISQVKIMPA